MKRHICRRNTARSYRPTELDPLRGEEESIVLMLGTTKPEIALECPTRGAYRRLVDLLMHRGPSVPSVAIRRI